MLIKFTLVGIILLLLGYWLTFQLYKSRGKKLRGSELETKILLWVPIYLLTILFAYSNNAIRSIFIVWVVANCWYELTRQRERLDKFLYLYGLVVSLGVVSALLLAQHSKSLFMAIWLMSVLSDVMAFFAGNFFGRHFLPSKLNSNKSYEGVGGQLAGALAGFSIVNWLIVAIPTWLIFSVGIGSALGDLTNSYFKRLVGVKEWSHRLPGHGGYLDRFSSLSFALLLSYIVLRLR